MTFPTSTDFLKANPPYHSGLALLGVGESTVTVNYVRVRKEISRVQ